MNPQLIADLESARALIDTPEKWTQGTEGTHHPTGRCLCAADALGEVTKRMGRTNEPQFFDCVHALGFTQEEHLWDWNDAPERTHAEVLELFDKAITNERSKA